MSDPTEIFLQPECCAIPGEGRLWCEHDAPESCMDGVPWTRYVRADEIQRLERELERFARLYGDEGRKNKVLLEVLSERDAELAEARGLLRECKDHLDEGTETNYPDVICHAAFCRALVARIDAFLGDVDGNLE